MSEQVGTVERLRNHVSVRRQSPAITNPRFAQEADLMAEAADEIDRLRLVMAEVVSDCPNPECGTCDRLGNALWENANRGPTEREVWREVAEAVLHRCQKALETGEVSWVGNAALLLEEVLRRDKS